MFKFTLLKIFLMKEDEKNRESDVQVHFILERRKEIMKFNELIKLYNQVIWLKNDSLKEECATQSEERLRDEVVQLYDEIAQELLNQILLGGK